MIDLRLISKAHRKQANDFIKRSCRSSIGRRVVKVIPMQHSPNLIKYMSIAHWYKIDVKPNAPILREHHLVGEKFRAKQGPVNDTLRRYGDCD